jgi:hypothetical protein
VTVQSAVTRAPLPFVASDNAQVAANRVAPRCAECTAVPTIETSTSNGNVANIAGSPCQGKSRHLGSLAALPVQHEGITENVPPPRVSEDVIVWRRQALRLADVALEAAHKSDSLSPVPFRLTTWMRARQSTSDTTCT